MVNFSDLSRMAGKLDVAGLVKNVKSMVNPDQAADSSAVASATAAGDPLSQKMLEINSALQALTSMTAQQAEAVSKLNKAWTGLSQEIEALKKPVAQEASSATPAAAVEHEHAVAKETAVAGGATEKPGAEDKVGEKKQGE